MRYPFLAGTPATLIGSLARGWSIPTMLLGALAVWLAPSQCTADDWARWMGPRGDNSWHETGILDRFPAGGPKVLWRTPIAGGYAGPSVSQGKVFVTDYVTDDNVKIANFERRQSSGTERVLCLDEATGKELWKYEYPVTYAISYPSGPRCTPIVDGDRVYCLGAEGLLACLQVSDGSEIWSINLTEKYNTKAALWGYAGHPLIDGDQLITLAGGEGSHVVSLNKMTGEENWRALTAPEQGYCPPLIIRAGGVRQLILPQPDAVESVNPENGELYWSLPYQAQSGSIIMTPVAFDNHLYVAGYSRQSMLIDLDPDQPKAKTAWKNQSRAISPVNVQPYLDRKTNTLYGADQSGDMVALELPSGKRLWATPKPISERRVGNGTAFLVRQGDTDRFWLFNESGELIIAKLTTEGYEEIDRAAVIEPSNNAFGRPVVWSMPAFASRHAYIRSDSEIICVDLAAPQTGQ